MAAARKPRRFAAPIVGFFIAGAGHVTVGRYRRALAWLAADVALNLAFALALPRTTAKLIPAYVVAALLVRVASIVDVAFLPPADSDRLPGWGIAILLWVTLFATSAFAGLSIRIFLLEAFKIPAGSMSPTLIVGDHILVDKTARAPVRGAVMVFRYPKEPSKDFVKRVIAIAGDTVEIRDGAVLLNGQPIERRPVAGDCHYPDYEYGDETTLIERSCDGFEETLDGHTYSIVRDKRDAPPPSFPPVTVPPNQFYVLGDNRDNSHDSRYWGFVPDENLKGRAVSIWWSTAGGKVRSDRIGIPVR